MRRGLILSVGLLALCITAYPQTASAQPPDVFGIVRNPLSTIFGAVGRIVRPPAPRRAVPSRPRPPAAARGTAAAAAGAAAVSTGDAAAVPLPASAPADRRAGLSTRGDDAQQRRDTPQIGDVYRPVRWPSQLGLAVPLAWPNAYEDILGFALWPADYQQRLRAHGIGDILISIFAPTELAAQARLAAARVSSGGQAAAEPGRRLNPCASASQVAPDWPGRRLELLINTNRTQRIALEGLRQAVSEAVALIRESCREEELTTPVRRLRAMQNQLWAVQEAAIMLREPLAEFYDSLTDEQRSQFIVAAGQAEAQSMNAAQKAQQDGPRASTAMTRQQQMAVARMCGMPLTSEWPARQIEQMLQPTEAQRASLQALQKIATEMGQLLMASCLQPPPPTPAERLDAAADRLTAVVFAASNVSLALNDFYGQLSDEQKTQFSALSY